MKSSNKETFNKSPDPLVNQLIVMLRRKGVRCGTGADIVKLRATAR
jgi:hypothetical protein